MRALARATLACGFLSFVHYTALAQAQVPVCSPPGKYQGLMMVTTRAGCPLSAVIEETDTRTRTDGTRVQTTRKTLVYRNSAGRLRYEMYAPADKPGVERLAMIVILDPETGVVYRLEPHPELDRVAPAQGLTAQPFPPPAPVLESRPVLEHLGTQDIDGLLATGRRLTVSISTGADGEDQSIKVVTEEWESVEIGITLLTNISDPRSGEFVTRIKNLHFSEPDPALFQVATNNTTGFPPN